MANTLTVFLQPLSLEYRVSLSPQGDTIILKSNHSQFLTTTNTFLNLWISQFHINGIYGLLGNRWSWSWENHLWSSISPIRDSGCLNGPNLVLKSQRTLWDHQSTIESWRNGLYYERSIAAVTGWMKSSARAKTGRQRNKFPSSTSFFLRLGPEGAAHI